MQRVIEISLMGHADPYRLDEEAFELLRHYLERARSRLSGDPDHAEVIGDLERAIGQEDLGRGETLLEFPGEV